MKQKKANENSKSTQSIEHDNSRKAADGKEQSNSQRTYANIT